MAIIKYVENEKVLKVSNVYIVKKCIYRYIDRYYTIHIVLITKSL